MQLLLPCFVVCLSQAHCIRKRKSCGSVFITICAGCRTGMGIKMKLHASGEDYLEAILVLHKKMGMVRSVDVARHMEVTKPSVCHAVATLKEGGFLTMDEDFFLHLTDLGREIAEQTYEKHRFFTDLLTEAGVDPASAERDACRMEHVISQESFEHLRDAYNAHKEE